MDVARHDADLAFARRDDAGAVRTDQHGVRVRLSTFFTRIMSSTGMPSVIVTMTRMPASVASRIASAANGGGTKIIVASAPVSSTASCTVLKTGRPMCSVPPLPGVTPPTTLVP